MTPQTPAPDLITRVLGAIVRWPKLVLALHLAITLALAIPAASVQRGLNVEDFFPRQAPERQTYDRMARLFPDDGWATVLLRPHDPTALEVLNAIEKFAERLRHEAIIYKVKTVLDVKDITGNRDEIRPLALISSELRKSEADLARKNRWDQIRQDERFRAALLDPAGRMHALRVQMDPSRASDSQARAELRKCLLRESAQLQSELQKLAPGDPGIFVLPTGLPVIRAAYVELIDLDSARLSPIALGMTLLLLILMFRHPRDIAIPLLVVILTLIWTIGFLGIFGKVLNQILQMTPVILIVVGVSDSIHIVKRVHDIAREAPPETDLKECIVTACREMTLACWLTSATTIVGFLSLVTTNIETLVDFGLFTALGVTLAFVITVTLLPAIFALWPPRASFDKSAATPEDEQGARAWWEPIFTALAHWTQKYRRGIHAFCLLITLLGAWSLKFIDRTAYVFDDLHPGSPLELEIRKADELYSGVLPLTLLIEGPAEAMTRPDVLRAIKKLREQLRGLPELESVQALDLTIARSHRVWNDDQPQDPILPDSQAAIDQYMLLLPQDLAYEFVKADQSVILTRCRDLGSVKLRPLLDKVEALTSSLRAELKPLGMSVSVTGTTPLVQQVYDSIVGSLISSLMVSVLFMALLFGLLFRSIKAVILALLPNLLPILLLASSLWIFGIALKPSTVIIFSVTFGIAVDDTIHFLARFRAERMSGRPYQEALERTFRQTGAAIVTTSLVLSAGFAVLCASAFGGVANLGLLLCVGIIVALLCDLFMLPALLASSEVDFGPVGPPQEAA